LKFWINVVNEEGFTALHMASYRGNLVNKLTLIIPKGSVIILLNSGASCLIHSHSGLQVIHAASQGNSPLMIVSIEFFIELIFLGLLD